MSNGVYVNKNGEWINTSGGGSSGVTVDSELSSTSENPVQNKVITSALNGKQDTMSAGTGISISGTTINHSNSITAKTSYVGSATAVPRIQYDAQGHITACTTATIYPPTTVGTSGQYWESDGSGAGAWVTKDTAPTSGSTKAVTSGAVYTALNGKQNKLTAGDGITIENNVISATGGGESSGGLQVIPLEGSFSTTTEVATFTITSELQDGDLIYITFIGVESMTTGLTTQFRYSDDIVVYAPPSCIVGDSNSMKHIGYTSIVLPPMVKNIQMRMWSMTFGSSALTTVDLSTAVKDAKGYILRG